MRCTNLPLMALAVRATGAWVTETWRGTSSPWPDPSAWLSVRIHSFPVTVHDMLTGCAAPWGVMGGGKYKSPEEIKQKQEECGVLRGGQPQSEAEIKICQVLQEVSDEIGQGHSVASGE